ARPLTDDDAGDYGFAGGTTTRGMDSVSFVGSSSLSSSVGQLFSSTSSSSAGMSCLERDQPPWDFSSVSGTVGSVGIAPHVAGLDRSAGAGPEIEDSGTDG